MNRYPPRPGSVVAAAVLLMVYGGLMLVCSFCGVLEALGGNPEAEVLAKELPANQIITIIQAVSNLLVGVTMILLGVYILQLKNLARIGAYVVCTYEILLLLVHSVYLVVFVFPVTERVFAEQAKNNPPIGFDFAAFMQGFMWLNLAFTFLFTVTICGLIMFFLSGAKARAAFADEFDAPDAPPEESRRRRYEDYDDDDDYRPPPRSSGETGITDRG